MSTTDRRELSGPVRRSQELLPAAASPSKVEAKIGRSDPGSIPSNTDGAIDNPNTIQPEEKLWRIGTTVCVVVGFSYITETGQSWAGPIEKATFRVENTVFEHCLGGVRFTSAATQRIFLPVRQYRVKAVPSSKKWIRPSLATESV